MSDKRPFSGDNYDSSPFTKEDNASHREMLQQFRAVWPTIEGMHNLNKGATQFVKIAAVLGGLGAAVAYLVKTGLL